MEFSCHLYKLLVGDVKLITEDISLVNSILQIFVSTMKISQKRKMFQPHFTLSLEALFRLYKAVNVDNTSGTSANSELGLNAILMSIPSIGILYLVSLILSLFRSLQIYTFICICKYIYICINAFIHFNSGKLVMLLL